MTTRIFKDTAAKKRFIDLYELLSEPAKSDFGAAVRKAADEKVTSLDELNEFYLTDIDVTEIYESLPGDPDNK